MVRAQVLQGARQMRFEGLLERGELLQEEAAEMLGISERTFSAVARPVARRGAGGLAQSADRQAVEPADGGCGDPAVGPPGGSRRRDGLRSGHSNLLPSNGGSSFRRQIVEVHLR
jgi:hypothetical protein